MSANTPCTSCPGVIPPCPRVAELRREGIAFSLKMRQRKSRQPLLLRLGTFCVCVWEVLCVWGFLPALCSFGGKAIAGSGELRHPRAAALLGEILHLSGTFLMPSMSVYSQAREEEARLRKQAAGCDPLRFPKRKCCDRAKGSDPIQRWVRGDPCSGWARGPRDQSQR